MGIVIHKTGDIFTTTARAIGHGVNTLGVMGAGIAVQFKNRFPDMYQEYRTLCEHGTLEPGGMYAYEFKPGLFVYNIASQKDPGPNAELAYLAAAVGDAVNHAEAHGVPVIALPRIGSGIGGLNETDVESILRALVRSRNVNIELWTFGSPA